MAAEEAVDLVEVAASEEAGASGEVEASGEVAFQEEVASGVGGSEALAGTHSTADLADFRGADSVALADFAAFRVVGVVKHGISGL